MTSMWRDLLALGAQDRTILVTPTEPESLIHQAKEDLKKEVVNPAHILKCCLASMIFGNDIRSVFTRLYAKLLFDQLLQAEFDKNKSSRTSIPFFQVKYKRHPNIDLVGWKR